MTEQTPKFAVLANQESDRIDADVLLYNGRLQRHSDQRVIELCRKRQRRKNLVLLLVTGGGDANVAFRISRCLQQHYERFSLFVSGYCKSAGTLICAGAHDLIVSPEGELGPLDVQLARRDELFETQSSLTTTAALQTLNDKAFSTFEDFMLQVKVKGGVGISTRLATEIASNLTVGLYAPVYQQIDPMHVGETGRALEIARQYAQRLNKHGQNLKDGAIDRLVAEYPSHDFIIDASEAERLFHRVTLPSDTLVELAEALGPAGRWPTNRDEIISFLSDEKTGGQSDVEQQKPGSEAKQAGGEAGSETTAGLDHGGGTAAGNGHAQRGTPQPKASRRKDRRDASENSSA